MPPAPSYLLGEMHVDRVTIKFTSQSSPSCAL